MDVKYPDKELNAALLRQLRKEKFVLVEKSEKETGTQISSTYVLKNDKRILEHEQYSSYQDKNLDAKESFTERNENGIADGISLFMPNSVLHDGMITYYVNGQLARSHSTLNDEQARPFYEAAYLTLDAAQKDHAENNVSLTAAPLEESPLRPFWEKIFRKFKL